MSALHESVELDQELYFRGTNLNSNHNGQINYTNEDPLVFKTYERFPNSVFFNTQSDLTNFFKNLHAKGIMYFKASGMVFCKGLENSYSCLMLSQFLDLPFRTDLTYSRDL